MHAALDRRISFDTLDGAKSLTVAELQRAIDAGARFVLFQYCISVLVLSFKRSSGVFLILPAQNTWGERAKYSAISLVAGWWGIPWGPIWTLWTVGQNLSGGKDVTAQVMSGLGLPYNPAAQYSAGSR